MIRATVFGTYGPRGEWVNETVVVRSADHALAARGLKAASVRLWRATEHGHEATQEELDIGDTFTRPLSARSTAANSVRS